MRIRPVIAAAVALAVLGSASTSEARSRRGLQRRLNEAKALFVEQKYPEALEIYEGVHKQTKMVALLYMVGRCREEMGQLEAALEAYRAVLDGRVPAKARKKTQQSLEQLEERMKTATLVLEVSPAGAAVTVDGAAKGAAPLEPLTLQPGAHRVVATLAGYVEATTEVDLKGGRRDTIVLKLQEVPKPEVPIVIQAPSGPDYAPWTWVTLGIGSALVIVGTSVAIVGDLDHQEVADANPRSMTKKDAQALADSGDTKKLAGWALMGTGIAALAASGTLFILEAVGAPDQPATGGGAGVTATTAPTQGGALFLLDGRF